MKRLAATTVIACFIVWPACVRYTKRVEAHRNVTGDSTVYFLDVCYYAGLPTPGKIPVRCDLICTSPTRLPVEATKTGVCN